LLHIALLPVQPSRRTFAVFYAGVTMVAAIAAIVVWAQVDARREARHQAEQAAANITLSLVRQIQLLVLPLDISLQNIVRGMATPGPASLPAAVQRSILFDGTLDTDAVDKIFVTDDVGCLVRDSRVQPTRVDCITDRPYFVQQRDHPNLGLLISEPLHSRRNGELFVTFSRRIDDPDGRFAGIVVAGLSLSRMQSMLSGLSLGPHDIINVVTTDNGTLLARHPYTESDIGRSLLTAPLFGHLKESEAGLFESPSQIDDIVRSYSYRKVDGLNLVVVVGVETHAIFAAWRQRSVLLGVIVFTLLMIELVLARKLRRELARRHAAETAAQEAILDAERGVMALGKAMAPIETLFKNTTDLMLVIRVMGGEFIYEAVNPNWEQLVGVAAGAAIGQTSREVLPIETADMTGERWRDCVAERSAQRQSIEFPSGSGREWDVLIMPVLDADQAVGRLIVVGRETTERTRLESDLRQAQKMEMIGRMAAGVSHDFNNILQIITGGVETLRDEQDLSRDSRDILEMVYRASHRGAYLTHHLLAYSRKQILAPKITDLANLLNRLVLVLSRTLGADIAMSLAFDGPVGTVIIDRNQLETALMNLGINAAHAMPDGGSLRFEVGSADAVPFGELRPGRHVCIAVTDTGCGMRPEVLERIFDPFFTTKGLDGTGLGLAMVQGFCRQSGGDVRAMSEPGEGARFEIWLPEASVCVPVHGPTDAWVDPASGGHVLVVDDMPDVLRTMVAFLRSAGFATASAVGAKEALSMIQAGQYFDLLVTDYMMPSMKGPELIRQARLLRPGLPAVVISGYADVSEFVTDLPNTRMLHKPFSRTELVEQVGSLLKGQTK
jgi:signal transduction histidine kinase